MLDLVGNHIVGFPMRQLIYMVSEIGQSYLQSSNIVIQTLK